MNRGNKYNLRLLSKIGINNNRKIILPAEEDVNSDKFNHTSGKLFNKSDKLTRISEKFNHDSDKLNHNSGKFNNNSGKFNHISDKFSHNSGKTDKIADCGLSIAGLIPKSQIRNPK